MTVAGTQTLVAPIAPASNLDNIRKAMTLVRVNARSEPIAVVLNPTDAQNIDLLKANNEANNFVGPGPYGVGAARLEPGDYTLICFLPDPKTGKSHVKLGMKQSFSVK